MLRYDVCSFLKLNSEQPCSWHFCTYLKFLIITVYDVHVRVKLPFKVDIIKHPCEVDGKSTAVHAAILAPHHVTVYRFPDIPDYSNSMKVTCITLVSCV